MLCCVDGNYWKIIYIYIYIYRINTQRDDIIQNKYCCKLVEDLPQGTSHNLTSPSMENHACFVIRRTRVQISLLTPDILTNYLIVFLTSVKPPKNTSSLANTFRRLLLPVSSFTGAALYSMTCFR